MTKGGTMLLAIPMKDPALAKTRLGLALSASQRAALATALFLNVVKCARHARRRLPDRQIDIAVISSSPTMRELARSYNLLWLDDGGAPTLSMALERAAQAAKTRSYDALCILPGDLADPTIDDLAQLLAQPAGQTECILCPSKDLGTNALILPLPAPFPFCYGERSFHHHYRAAVACGLRPRVLPLTSLRRDVDTVADLAELEGQRPDLAVWSDGR